jgi:hypothetical protein
MRDRREQWACHGKSPFGGASRREGDGIATAPSVISTGSGTNYRNRPKDGSETETLLEQIEAELRAHTAIEEGIFYPAFR